MSVQVETEIQRPPEHPAYSENYSLLYSHEQIQQGIREMAKRLYGKFSSQGIDEIVAVTVMEGARYFGDSLLHYLGKEGMRWIRSEDITAETYENEASTGTTVITKDIRRGIKNKHSLLIEDVLETGSTLTVIQNHLHDKDPLSLTTVLLAAKTPDHLRTLPPMIDDVVFAGVRGWLVGFGFDTNGFHRQLPNIYIKKSSILIPEVGVNLR